MLRGCLRCDVSLRQVVRTTPLAIVTMLVACGGAPEPRPTTSASVTSSEASYTPPPAPWDQLDHDARRTHMVQHVLPAATDLFASWSAERYADFSCETCHGSDASARSYTMPNPTLITLYPTGTIGQQRVLAEHTEACTFMFSRLVPAMQTMLAAPDFDPATHEGFTCFSCHPQGAPDDPLSQPAPTP